VPRWFILGCGASSALMALLALLLSRPQQRQTSGQPEPSFRKGEDAPAYWAIGKGALAHFRWREATRPADRLAG
jgi:hypothetical protein